MQTKYSNLNLLRSMAVLSVVSSHLWSACVDFHVCAGNVIVTRFFHNLGFTGVTFFFVHTSLVLMLSMHRAPDAHRARNFVVRRAFRIYPLCWAAILLVLTTGLTDTSMNGLFRWRNIAANLLLVVNLDKSHGSVSIMGPLWSLPLEVQMYLVLPLFFVALRRYQWLGTVFLIWLGSTLLAIVVTQMQFHNTGAIYPPMFISGMVAYRLLIRQQSQPDHRALPSWGWPLLVMSLFMLAPLLIGSGRPFSPTGAIVNSCNCFLLGLAIPSFHELTSGWVVRPAEQIAKYSYGVYLFHVPAIIFCFRFLPGLPIALKIPASLALTALMSFVAFHAIEDPMIQLGKRLTSASPPVHSAAQVAAS